MGLIWVHIAVPVSRKADSCGLVGLSGQDAEFSIRATAIALGHSAEWNAAQGQSLEWYCASQRLADTIAQTMLIDGMAKQVEAWYVAADESRSSVLDHNLPGLPVDASFDAFLADAGLARVEPVE